MWFRLMWFRLLTPVVLIIMLPMEHACGHPPLKTEGRGDVRPEEEAFIHTPAGFAQEGKPSVADPATAAHLEVAVFKRRVGSTIKPAFCRVNVVGADGNYYQPRENPLAPWSLDKTANRAGKAPIRYYGWFFYTNGHFTVDVPPGPVRVEVWKGFEFRPVTTTTHVSAGQNRRAVVMLERTLSMADAAYYSGDTHIHLDRTTQADDDRALDLIAAEDIRYGFILCMNDPRSYTGTMARQIWPQTRGFGPTSIVRRGDYTIASGQEYRCGTYGHICLLMHRELVLGGQSVDPNQWPVFGMVGRETRSLGGYSFHAHGGYSKEIYADFAQRATDGVELLQFAEYRGVSLAGWYRMLNVGYRFPAIGACDFPYCRALGDSRTYVLSSGPPPDVADWVRAAAEGRSFFTTGPMIALEVDRRRPGDTLSKAGPGPHRVTARVRVRSEVAPVTNVELIVNGATVRQLIVPAAEGLGNWLELEEPLDVSESSWIAARAWSTAASGKPDSEAHTNPVYVIIDGRAPYLESDLDWLVERLDELIAEQQKREFPEQPQVVDFYRESREELLRIRTAGGQKWEP